MQFFSALTALTALTMAQACFLTAHSSTVGNFDVQHSAPSDHGGAPQTITGSHGSCSFSGNLENSCAVDKVHESGCGSLSFTIRAPGK